MYRCRGCNKDFDSKKTRQAHESRCTKWKEWRDGILTYDTLHQLYVVDGISANSIGEQLGVGNAAMIIKALKRFGIPTRSISESHNTEFVKEKIKKTNIERYGFEHNFSRNHPSRKKWQERLLREEGIVNVFQRPDVKRKSLISLMNSSSNSQTHKTKSSIHIRTMTILNELGIPFKDEKIISDGTLLKYYDIHILGTKKLIEVNGDYWHANPAVYKKDDLLNWPGGRVRAETIWNNDKIKKELAEKYGYDILYIWESDFSEPEKVRSMLINYLGVDNENRQTYSENQGISPIGSL